MEHDLTKGPITRTLVKFVVPFLISTVVQFLYTIVDMIVIGRFTNSISLAAINTSGQIMIITTMMIVGLATGGTVVIGQNFGAGKKQEVKNTIGGILFVFIVASIVITAFLLIFTKGLIQITRVPGPSVAPAESYLRICAWGVVFLTGYNCISGVLRGIGDSRHPMYFVIVSCLFNIAGDLLLVGGFGMGADGAALATVVSQALAFVLSIITLQKSEYPLRREALHFQSAPFKNVMRLGIPLGLQEVLPMLSFLLITVIINNMGYVERSAGVGIVERVIGFGQMWPTAFAPALSAFTAQNFGAKEYDRTKQGLKISILICLVATTIVFVFVFLFPQATLSIFSTEPDVIKYGADYLTSYAFDIPLVSFVFCLNGFFSGYGKTRFTMFNCTLSTFAIRVPIVYFASRIANVSFVLIGCAAPITSAAQIVMQLIYYRFGSWRKAS